MTAGRALVVMMARVKKTTGGKLWLKPWGVPKISQTAKVNIAKRKKRIADNYVGVQYQMYLET